MIDTHIQHLRDNFPRPAYTNHSDSLRRAVWELERTDHWTEEKANTLFKAAIALDEAARCYVADRTDLTLAALLQAWAHAKETYEQVMGRPLPCH